MSKPIARPRLDALSARPRRYTPLGRKRRQLIYDHIRLYKFKHGGKSPTIRELCDLTGITSTSVMYYILQRLQTQGAIRLTGGYSTRGIEVIGEQYTLPAAVEIR